MAGAQLLLALLVASACHLTKARVSINLEGEWAFALDPSNPTTRKLVKSGGKVEGSIQVPGAWQVQGYGEETATLKHQYIGAATYSRKLRLTSDVSRDLRLFIVAERVERSGRLYIGGRFICEHYGFMSNLDCEITSHAQNASEIEVSIVVNSTRNHPRDGLDGETDLDTDGTNINGWGGLGGHLRLEGRSRDGWMTDPHIRQEVAEDLKTAKVNASVSLNAAANGLTLHVTFTDTQNRTVKEVSGKCTKTACDIPDVDFHAPELWSPDTPSNQYIATFNLVSESGKVVDRRSIKFGFRRLDVIGYHWKLNGKWLYLFGYGDDSIYPQTMAPPVTHSIYESRMALHKGIGMNYVRHHSHVLPDEYFEVACSVGIMVSAEFPLAYGGTTSNCPGTACNDYYLEQYAAMVKRIRNYPCLFDYTLNNEDVVDPLGNKVAAIAHALDPGRPVNTADGVFSGSNAATMPLDQTEEFRPVQFEVTKIPIGDAGQYHIDGTPPVPITNHEFGNYVTFPRFEEQMSRFKDNIKPYWLQPAYDHLKKKGLIGENDLWSYCSNQLYMFCWKNSVEALRKTEKISGYEWWLVQDYWMGSNGFVDTYYHPKHPKNEMDQIKQMNNPVMLLVAEPGDNLPIDASAPRFLRTYVSKGKLATSFHVSNQGSNDINDGTLKWKLSGTREGEAPKTFCDGSVDTYTIKHDPNPVQLVDVECTLPDLGSLGNSPKTPLTLKLEAELLDGAGKTISQNFWRSRVYATPEVRASPQGHTIYTLPKYCNSIMINNMHCKIPPSGTKLPTGSVLVVDNIDGDILRFASEGATVLLIKGSDSANFGGLPTDPATFKTAWWLGTLQDNNMGTVVYNASKPITKGMAPDGWADEGWYNLVQGGQNFILDGTLEDGVEVLVRSIDIMGSSVAADTWQENPYEVLSRSKALVWQASVLPSGASPRDRTNAGAIIASGLNLLVNTFACDAGLSRASKRLYSRPPARLQSSRGAFGGVQVPEAAWMLHQLLEYAFTEPKPAKHLEARITDCVGCVPNMTWTLCGPRNSEPILLF